MMIRQLFPFLLLLVFGCSNQILTLASQPAAQSGIPTAETSNALLSPHMEDTERSSQQEALGDGNAMKSLDVYQWKNRLLLVFAPLENHPAYQRQMQLFEGKKSGFDDRDLLVVKLLAEGTSYLDSQSIDEATAAQLRSQFNVGQEEFRVILVGKDGTSKRRDNTPVEPTVIFNQIDGYCQLEES